MSEKLISSIVLLFIVISISYSSSQKRNYKNSDEIRQLAQDLVDLADAKDQVTNDLKMSDVNIIKKKVLKFYFNFNFFFLKFRLLFTKRKTIQKNF
jgi:capsule polysaccharide export protein KpsC/LpsZ